MSQPFKLSITDYYPRDSYPIYSGSDDGLDKTMDFMAVKPLDVQHDYGLQFKIKASAEKTQKLDVLFTNAMMKVLLSPKAMQIIENLCPEQVQVFDAVIECKDGRVDTYKALNILNEVDVSDPEKSEIQDLGDGCIVGYHKFVIKDQAMEPIHIGREKNSSAIIISATLKEAFEKAKIKGCQYWPGDDV